MTGALALRRPLRVPGWLSPASLVGFFLLAYVGWVLANAGGDPTVLATLGDGFANGEPVGEPGYDGQFTYWMARDPRPSAAAPHLDVPAYRYQRLLYPLLAWALALGSPAWVPWTLLLVGAASQVAGTRVVEAWLAEHGFSRWYALTYGLWPGLVMAVRLDLAEPLAYGLAAGALLAHARGRLGLAALCLASALLAKETALTFAAALLGWALWARHWRALAGYALALLPAAGLQLLLLHWFGRLGLGSGGYLGTPFEWIPYMGLWRIASVSVPAFALLAALALPLAVLPSACGLVAAVRRLWQRDVSPAVLALGANAALVAAMPFSTFREPLGLIRLLTGLVLAAVLFGAQARSPRVLRYALFWLSALVLAVRG